MFCSLVRPFYFHDLSHINCLNSIVEILGSKLSNDSGDSNENATKQGRYWLKRKTNRAARAARV